MITNFQCKIFRQKEVIIERGEIVEKLYFINAGVVHLYGFNKRSEDITDRFKIVTFKKGAWYGDY